MACAMPLTPIEVPIVTNDLVIDAKNVGVSFKVLGGVIEAVRDVSFTLAKGQTIALVGESGSGKSVTARALMQLLSKRAMVSPQTEIRFNNKDLAKATPTEMRKMRGNRMSKASIETACWDLEAKKLGVPLWQLLGGTRRRIECAS